MSNNELLPEVFTAGVSAEELLAEAEEAVEALLEAEPMAVVAYTFACDDSPDAAWQVRDIDFHEALSEPYRMELTLVTQDVDVDATGLLGADCELTIDRQPAVRTVRGMVRAVESLGVSIDRLQVRVEIVPAFEVLRDRVDTRLWQRSSVKDVVREVLEAGLGDYGRSVELSGLKKNYPPREYIVQYHESDFDFVSRLLEEEGIHYRFDHEAGAQEVMLLEDGIEGYDAVLTIDDNPMLYLVADLADQAAVETVQGFAFARELSTTSVYQRIFNWLDPTAPIEAVAPAAGGQAVDERNRMREVYHHGRFVEDDPNPRTTRKLAHRRDLGAVARGIANVTGFSPGRRFAFIDSARPELLHVYVLERVSHRGDCPEVMLNNDGDQPRYQNHFQCRILDPERPPRPLPLTRRPKIQGPQTAIVTGPASEEIHTDEHGRVKVRFDWDREHGLRDDSSMWIRVAHHWAGPGFGTFFVPRIGMEVVVEFLEGDPDKPLITGCVYNGDHPTAVSVPANKTRSTIRSESSPGGGGFNEFRFEDAAGAEEIFLHAQRDFNEMVLHCHSTTVLVNQTNTVGVNQTNTVGANQTELVGGNQSMTVEQARTKTVVKDETNTIQGNRSTTVEQDESLTVLGTTTVDSTKTVTLECQADYIQNVGGLSQICVNAGKAGAGDSSLTATNKIFLSQDGAATVELTGGAATHKTDATFDVAATGNLCMSTDASMSASASSSITMTQGGATMGFSGSEVTVSAAKVVIQVGGNHVTVDGGGVAVKGGSVDITADGTVAVSGALIKLN